MIPVPGTPEFTYHRFSRRLSSAERLKMSTSVRNDMIRRIWSAGVLDTVDIAAACGCRESTVWNVLRRSGEGRMTTSGSAP